MERKKICADCIHWEPGDFWGTGSGKHGVLVESLGWCMSKKDKNGNIFKRKRWNYHSACTNNFTKKKMTGFCYMGGGGTHTIQEDLQNISELMKELAEDNNIKKL